jgi:hypothetical protein
VAVPTVYASVGSKQELVVALNDLIEETDPRCIR